MLSMSEYILQKRANNRFYPYTPNPEDLKNINNALGFLKHTKTLNQKPLSRVEFEKRMFNK
tara:strand:+ start:334 stop:516 length:183 start_codon:yes stop_codon:yes gene_type:complete